MASVPVELWNSYELNEVTPYWARQQMPRREARAEFNRTMVQKESRVAKLRLLLDGYGISLAGTDALVQELNDWFVGVMSPLDDRYVPDGVSLSICEDVALFLGDVMISRHPELRWEFFTWGKRNVAYQSHVITGFPFDDPKLHTNLDLSRIVYGYAVRILETNGRGPHPLELPGHLLDGVIVDSELADPSEFVSLLDKVDRRFQAD